VLLYSRSRLGDRVLIINPSEHQQAEGEVIGATIGGYMRIRTTDNGNQFKQIKMSENRSNNPVRTGTNGNNRNQTSWNRYRRKTIYQSNRGPTNSFRGKVTEMNGNVFQLATERKKKDQFDDTLEVLKIYASTKFAEDIAHLDPLFRKLKRPTVAKPVKPEPTSFKNEDGRTTVIPVDSMDADIYKERMKKYDKKWKCLKAHSEPSTTWLGGKPATC